MIATLNQRWIVFLVMPVDFYMKCVGSCKYNHIEISLYSPNSSGTAIRPITAEAAATAGFER